MLKFFRLCLLSLLVVFVFSGCSKADSDLLGYWLSTEGAVLHFVSGTEVYIGEYASDDSVLCPYNLLSKDKISYRIDDTVFVYKFVVDKTNHTLTLYAGNTEKESVVRVYHGSDYMQEEIAIGLTINNR